MLGYAHTLGANEVGYLCSLTEAEEHKTDITWSVPSRLCGCCPWHTLLLKIEQSDNMQTCE